MDMQNAEQRSVKLLMSARAKKLLNAMAAVEERNPGDIATDAIEELATRRGVVIPDDQEDA